MSDLPNGWIRAPLGDLLLRIEAGKSFQCEPRPARVDEWGVIKVSAMTWGSFREEENKAVPEGYEFNPQHEIKPGDILVSRANTEAYVGAPVLVGACRPRLLLSDKSLRLVPSPNIDRRWLINLLSSPAVRGEISRRATGTKDSMRNISQQSLAEIEVTVPPRAEQKHIVATLEDHLSRLEAATSALTNSMVRIDRLWIALLEDLASGARLDHSERIEIRTVAEVADVQGGIQKQPKRRPVDQKYPFLRVANVLRGELSLAEVHEIELFGSELERFRLQKGDLLVVEGNGSPDQIGRAATWHDEIEDCVHQNHLIRVRPGAELDSRYLELVWNSPQTVQQLRSSASSTSGLYTLSTAKIKAVRLPVPSRELQLRLVNELERWQTNLKKAEHLAQTAKRRGFLLRRNLLGEAFRGALVAQDPENEPADRLLERIRQESAASRPVRSTTGRTAKKARPKPAPAHSDAPAPTATDIQEGTLW